MGPIDPAVLPGFLAAMAVVELTPGPNMGYLAVLSAGRGRRAGLTAVAGVTLGLAVYMVAAAFGLTKALLVYPALYEGLRWAGVGYLLWLAVETWRGEREISPGAIRAAPDHGYFWRGFFANLLNVKAAIFYVALLPGFLNPARPALPQALALGGLHILISVVVHSSIVLGAARAGRRLDVGGDRTRARRIRRAFAVSTGLIAVWLAWETRR